MAVTNPAAGTPTQKESPHADLDEGRLEDLGVRFVGGPEVAAKLHVRFSLKYLFSNAQTRSISFVPNSPYGLIMRMTTRMTYGATSFPPPRSRYALQKPSERFS